MRPEGRQAFTRRTALAGGLALITGGGAQARAFGPAETASRLAQLERPTGGRLGVAALDTQTGAQIAYRADERFRFCSTIKLPLVAAILQRVDQGEAKLGEPLRFSRADLLDYAPVAKAHVAAGVLPLQDACAAAIELSDNTAANLLFARLGGPQALTAWLRRIGDHVTRSDRNEPALNTAPPGDLRDTTSPAAMLADMQAVLLGPVLTPPSRARLIGWMQACQTGQKRLRAGLPSGWRVGDKTGTWTGGHRVTANDVAIAWPPGRKPVLVTTYLTDASAPPDICDATLASVGRIVSEAFGAAHG